MIIAPWGKVLWTGLNMKSTRSLMLIFQKLKRYVLVYRCTRIEDLRYMNHCLKSENNFKKGLTRR